MTLIFYALITGYCIVMLALLIKWQAIYRKDLDMSASERQISVLILTISTLLWPVVLPLAYIELLDKAKRSNDESRAKRDSRLLMNNISPVQPASRPHPSTQNLESSIHWTETFQATSTCIPDKTTKHW
jgi:hypothetical protein